MTPPDEIVCETAEAFKRALRGVPWLVLLADPRPGDSVSVNGTDIVYRPPPPRDAAREAFEAWAPDHGLDVSPSTRAPFQSTGRGGAFYRYESTDIAYQAFLAGRASVKP